MWLVTHIFAVILTLVMATLLAILILGLIGMAFDRRHLPVEPVGDFADMANRWDDEPPVLPDPVARELEQQLDGGDGHG